MGNEVEGWLRMGNTCTPFATPLQYCKLISLRLTKKIIKGDQSCVFIGRTDVEAETPILWPPDVKS